MMGLESLTNSLRKELSMVMLREPKEKAEESTNYQCTLSVLVASSVKSMVTFFTCTLEALNGMK